MPNTAIPVLLEPVEHDTHDEDAGRRNAVARLCPNTGTDQCDSGVGCPAC